MKTLARSTRIGLLAVLIAMLPAQRPSYAGLVPATPDGNAGARSGATGGAAPGGSEDASGSPSEAKAAVDAIMLYDPENPDLSTMQRADVATQGLPRDPLGFVDWMKALREGSITPRTSLDGKTGMNVLDKDVILKNTKEMPWVRFPHLSHTMWLDCSNCHPAPFVAQAGANQIVMADIFRGKFCGMCHDRVAFVTFFSCMRCHSVPQTTPAGQK